MHQVSYASLTDAQKKIAQELLRDRARRARIDAELAARDLEAVHSEAKRRIWCVDPESWCEQKLGDVVWSGQRRILRSVRDHRRTAAKTCHEVGKSFIAGRVAAWWIDSHKAGEAFVVTTAPTGQQVKVILWKEIGRAHTHGKLIGRVNQTEWIVEVEGKEEVIAFGRKPSDYSPTAFQGIHAPFVLVIVDEANGVSGLWEAIDSVIANDNSKILAIGNPDVPTGEFYEACKPGSGWNVVQISAFDSPNFTGEPMPKTVLDQLIGSTYVEEKRRKWAPHWRWNAQHTKCTPPPGSKPEDTNPLWQSKVLGEFPTVQGDKSLIPLTWIRAAQERTLSPKGMHTLGLDVGGGGDSNVIAEAHGPVVRIVHEDRNPDTMETCGLLIETLRSTGAEVARVDVIGIGRGVVDRAREQNHPVIGINVGEAADDSDSYENLRAEDWWYVRERFEAGDIDIDPEDEDLAAELSSIRFERTSRGKIKVESKKDAKARGVPSPNRADALMLAIAKTGEITDTKSMMHQSPTPYDIPIPAGSVMSFDDMRALFGR